MYDKPRSTVCIRHPNSFLNYFAYADVVQNVEKDFMVHAVDLNRFVASLPDPNFHHNALKHFALYERSFECYDSACRTFDRRQGHRRPRPAARPNTLVAASLCCASGGMPQNMFAFAHNHIINDRADTLSASRDSCLARP